MSAHLVSKTLDHRLKLYVERPSHAAQAETAARAAASEDGFARMCRTFEAAVGYRLEYRVDGPAAPSAKAPWSYPLPSNSRMGRTTLSLPTAESSKPAGSGTHFADACQLAESIGDLVAELQRVQQALWKREAELAAGVPLVAQPQPQQHLAERMEAVLRSTAEALGCRAAAVYLLDDATTELKLRGSWGLPFERLLDAPRPLRSAAADLEALAGHAVALEDATDYPYWNVPENFPAAVCVPVSSPTMPLGTMWVFADAARPFSDHDVNLVEIGAGRIASDLEREMLMTETSDTARLRRAWDDAGYRREARTPQVAPLDEHWEIAGRHAPHDAATTEFYDWLTTDDDALCAALGSVETTDFSAALDLEHLRALWRGHARHESEPSRLLDLVGGDLWSGSSEPTSSNLLTLHADRKGLNVAAAGRLFAARFRNDGVSPLAFAGLPLGSDLDAIYRTLSLQLDAGELFAAADSEALLKAVAEIWLEHRRNFAGYSAGRWAEAVTELLGTDAAVSPQGSLLVVRRKT